MARDIRGKRVLLTGASGGIGQALARKLSSEGARLVLAGRSEEKLRTLAASLPSEVLPVGADLTVDADRQRLLDTAVGRFGGLDILINNAGIASWAHFTSSNEEILRQIMEVNFFAPVDLIRRAIPILTNGNHAAVVNVASMCGRKAMPAWSEYSASKYALCGLTESLRGELVRFGIDTLLIVPGLTNSGFPSRFLKTEGKANIEFDKGMPPEDVADAIVTAIRKNKTETVVGSDARRMLRMHRWFPRLLDWLIARRVKKLYQQA
ncbi:MAG: SDR family NAD(P)-dependent oxidoreductase [Gemmataceae bacterium]|nr:SDR family NAD(P)-dependent oxidoreductase [Gemmataceae bacterium]